MTAIETDICVIGAGSGGLSAAAGAVQLGAEVVLVEAGEMGGDCLNTGCVPSKALLAAAGRGLGWDAAHAHVAATIAAIAPHDSQDRFERLGVRVLRGHARFTGPRALEVNGDTIRARRYVIATGSSPAVPAIPGLDTVPYETNETIFALADRPDHLLILGGGPVGLEMAQAHRRLGCAVTVIEAATILSREDPEAVALIRGGLAKEGVTIVEGCKVERVTGAAGEIRLHVGANGGDADSYRGTHLMIAAGRGPNVDGLGLDAAGVTYTRAGIAVNAAQRTSNRRIYAIGDVTGGPMFTHAAGYQAGVVLRPTLFGLPGRATAPIPRASYTDPELGQVGLTEAEARAAHGDGVEVVRADLASNDRAVATGQSVGFLKVMVVGGRPVGATLVGEDAGEQTAFWALALSARLKMSAVAGTVLPYPTVAELSKRATGAYFSPRLFGNVWVKRMVRAVQRFVP